MSGKKKEGISKAKVRGRATVIIYFVLIVAALAGAVLTCIYAFFKINVITVNGVTLYNTEDIISYSGIEEGSNLLFADTKKAEENIFKTFPYVEKVKVEKKIPNTVEINVTETNAGYSIEYQGNYVYISSAGKILAKETEPKEGSVLVSAGEISDEGGYVKFSRQEQQDVFKEIILYFSDKDISKVTSININDIHDISLLYDNRITMKLGNAADIAYKINFGIETVDNKIKPEESGVLDLTVAKEVNQAYFSIDALNSESSKENTDSSEGETVDDGNSDGNSTGSDENQGEEEEKSEENTVNRGEDIPDVE